jgi:hypothetical protein
MKHTRSLALFSLLLLAACDDGGDTSGSPTDTGGSGDTTDTGGDDTTDTGGSGDTTEDTGTEDTTADTGSDDTTADTTADTVDDASLNCDEFERPLNGVCRSIYTRICFSQDDCRDEETCTFEGADTPATGGRCIFNTPPDLVCPDGPSCPTRVDATFKAAFGAVDITPSGFELPRANGGSNFNEHGNPVTFNGDVTDPTTFCDCGRDMICPPTPEFADCRSFGTYTGPDADGTEDNGFMEGAWIAGFEFSRPAGICPEEWLAADCTGPDCCSSPIAHDPIWARGAIFEQGESRIAVLTVDTVGWFYSDSERIKRRLDPALGIDELIISATHTHEAPDTMGQWGPGVLGSDLPDRSGVVDEWMEEIYSRVETMLADAVQRLEPVDVYAMQVHTGSLDVALRDSRPPFIANDLITGIRIVRDGAAATDPASTLGVFLNWHSHPEVLWSENVYITSDFPHFFREGAEKGLPEIRGAGESVIFDGLPALGGVAVYTTGTCGGLLTPGSNAPVLGLDGERYTGKDFARAKALGDRLAARSIEAFSTPCEGDNRVGCYTRITDETLSFSTRVFTTDIVNRLFHNAVFGLNLFRREVYNWRFQDGFLGPRYPQVKSAISQVRIGNLTMQTVPGETFSETWTGGFDPDNTVKNPIVGDPTDVNCGEDRVSRLDPGVEPRFACVFEQNIEGPPDLAAAPTSGYLYDALPGDYIYAIGLGNDELGYIVPTYDFVVDPVLPYLIQSPGDHYEETNSAGPRIDYFLSIIADITELLNR